MKTLKPIDIPSANGMIRDAERSASQARGALGLGDSTTALNHLSNAHAAILRAMKEIRERAA